MFFPRGKFQNGQKRSNETSKHYIPSLKQIFPKHNFLPFLKEDCKRHSILSFSTLRGWRYRTRLNIVDLKISLLRREPILLMDKLINHQKISFSKQTYVC
jgi:hypothetical protein